MTAASWPAAALCLFSGALLGVFFLFLKLLRVLLRGGRLLTAALDLAFCLTCGLAAFFIALALDRGRLRFFQAGLQLLGGWGAVTALDPFINAVARLIKRANHFFTGRIIRPALGCFGRAWHFLRQRVCQALPKPKSTQRKKPRLGRNKRKRKKLPPKAKNRKKPLEKLT